VVHAAKHIAGILVRQRGDVIHNLPDALAFRVREDFVSWLRRSRNHDRHLRALRQGDVVPKRHNAIFYATANDHTVIFGRIPRKSKLQWGRDRLAAEISAALSHTNNQDWLQWGRNSRK
jgi:hypothetical protein